MILQQCTDDPKQVNNSLVKIEQSITIRDSIISAPSLVQQGHKLTLIPQIIRIIEFFLKIVGKEMEAFQIQTLAGDLYDKFKNDSLDDIIIMFKMIRKGDFGKVDYTETFHQKLMQYATLYMHYKSEEREKLIELKKRKEKKQERETTMSPEALAKFQELRKRISDPIAKKAETFKITGAMRTLDAYLQNLPMTCKNLTDGELKYEIKRTQYSNKIAYEILLEEQQRRKDKRKNDKNNPNI